VDFSLKLLSQSPDTPDVVRRNRQSIPRIVSGKFVSASIKSTTVGWKDLVRGDQAELYCKDDTMVFELSFAVWSEQVVAKHTDDVVGSGRNDPAQLCVDFARLLQDPEHSDVTLLPSGKNRSDALRAHRIVLAARSPVFKQMFFGAGMQEVAPDSEVPMTDVDREVASLFLHALYTDEIQKDAWDDDEMMCHLFKAFHKYQVDDLMQRCEARISQ